MSPTGDTADRSTSEFPRLNQAWCGGRARRCVATVPRCATALGDESTPVRNGNYCVDRSGDPADTAKR
jgi:hypothetical protein